MRLGAIVVSGNDQREACIAEFSRYVSDGGLDIPVRERIRVAERAWTGGYHDAGNGRYCLTSTVLKPREGRPIKAITCEFAGQSYKWEVEVSERQGFLEHLGIEEQGDSFNFFNLQQVESGERRALSIPSERDLAYVLIGDGNEICATVVDLRNPDKSEFYRWKVENPKPDGGELS